MFACYFRNRCDCVFQDELTSRVMEQLRKKDRDSLLAEIQDLRKTSKMKPLIDQVTRAKRVFTFKKKNVTF